MMHVEIFKAQRLNDRQEYIARVNGIWLPAFEVNSVSNDSQRVARAAQRMWEIYVKNEFLRAAECAQDMPVRGWG